MQFTNIILLKKWPDSFETDFTELCVYDCFPLAHMFRGVATRIHLILTFAKWREIKVFFLLNYIFCKLFSRNIFQLLVLLILCEIVKSPITSNSSVNNSPYSWTKYRQNQGLSTIKFHSYDQFSFCTQLCNLHNLAVFQIFHHFRPEFFLITDLEK